MLDSEAVGIRRREKSRVRRRSESTGGRKVRFGRLGNGRTEEKSDSEASGIGRRRASRRRGAAAWVPVEGTTLTALKGLLS